MRSAHDSERPTTATHGQSWSFNSLAASPPKIGDGVERVQQAAVRDVGCDVAPEDLIDAEFGGAGNVITDLLDGSGQWDTAVAEWRSGNRAVDPHDHRPLGRACGFLVGPQLRGERVPVENDRIEAESQPACALRGGDRAGERADQDLRPSWLHRLRAHLGRRALVEPAWY